MGQIHGKIRIDKKAQPFINLPYKCITRLVEAFHLITENFTLTPSELQDIFKVSIRDSYRQSDDEFVQMTKGLFDLFGCSKKVSQEVDSFEMLAGLIVSSDMKAKEKIEKIIDLVDFETTKMFTIHQVALALRSTVAGMCKIADLDHPKSDVIDSLSSVVFSIVSENASVEYNQVLKKIKLEELISSTLSLPEIRRWLDHFNDLDEEDLPTLTGLPNLDNTKQLFESKCFGETPTTSACWEDMIQLCRSKTREEESLIPTNPSLPPIKMKLDWIYGRNTRNLSSSNAFYTSTGEIIYAAGSVGVKYRQDSCEGIMASQQYYIGHKHYISCITVSSEPDGQHGTLVATAEYCSKPEIHVWSSKSLLILQCLAGFHSVGIQTVDFSPSGELLLSMGMDTLHSVAIYNWKLSQIIFTARTSDFVLDCRFLHTDKRFGACGNSFFYIWETEDDDSLYSKSRLLFGKRFKRQEISCVATWKDNNIISGCRDGAIYIWEGRSCTSTLDTTRNKAPISVLNVSKSLKVYAGTTDGLLLIYDECLELLITHRINKFIRGSSCIDSLSCRGSNVLIGTVSGDLLEVKESNGTLVRLVTISNCAKGSIGLDTNPVDYDQVATVRNHDTLRILNSATKSDVKEFYFGAPISVVSYNSNGDRLVVGLMEPHAGQILVLDCSNFTIVLKSRPCNKTLLDCKHSKDGKYMAVGAKNHNIYIFDAKTYNVIARATGHTSAVNHIDFGSSPEMGVATSIRSNSINKEIMFWKLDGKQISPISERGTIYESCSCPINWDLRSLHQSINVDNVEVCVLSGQASIVVVADKRGEMKIFNFPPRQDECVISVQGHGGLIGNMKASKRSNSFFSVGKYDTCLMQWKIDHQDMHRKEQMNHETMILSNSTVQTLAPLITPSNDTNEKNEEKYSSNLWRKNIVEPTNNTSIFRPIPPKPFILDWVQGYNGSFGNNVFYSLHGVLIYPVGKIVIYHDMTRNEQSYYQEANDIVTALALHPSRNICALGKGLIMSEILCIDNESQQTIQILKGHENAPILGLKFNETGRLLAAISADGFHTLSIYDWEIKSCALKSTHTTKLPTYDFAFGTEGILQVGQNFMQFWSIDSFPVDLSSIHSKDQKSFHSALPHEAGFVVGTDDGFLYKVIDNEIVAEVTVCDSNSPILALNSCKKLIVCCSKAGCIGFFDKAFNFILSISTIEIDGIDNDTWIRSIACDDGCKVALGTQNNDIYEIGIDFDDGCNIHCTGKVEGHSGQTLSGMAICPDSLICATTADDQYLRLWNVHEMRLIRSLKLHTVSKSCCFSPDGTMIALGYGSSKKIFASESPGKWELLEVSTLKVLLEDRPTRKMITEIKWSNEGFMAVGSLDCKLYLYVVAITENGNYQATFLHVIGMHNSPIQHIDFSIGSKYLKVNCMYNLNFFRVEDGTYIEDISTIKDTEWESHNCTYSWDVMGVWSECRGSANVDCIDAHISSNGEKLLLAGLSQGDLGLFHCPCTTTRRNASRSMHVHHGRVGKVKWIDSESFVSIGLDDKSLIKWKVHPDAYFKLGDEIDKDMNKQCVQRNNHQRIGFRSADHNCEYEAQRIKRPWIATMVPPAHHPLNFHGRKTGKKFEMKLISGSDGRCLHSIGQNEIVSIRGSICLVQDTLQHQQRFFAGHNFMISCIAAPTQRKHLIATGEAGLCPNVKIWDINTCNEIGSLENGHNATIQFLVFADNDHILLSMGTESQHFVCIWKSLSAEWFDGKLHMRVQSGSYIPSFLVNFPGSFATGIETDVVCWNYDTHNIITPTKHLDINDEDKQPLSCGIRYGQRIATGTTNGFLYLWETEYGLTTKVKAHESSLVSLLETCNGALISGANDGTIIIWSIDLKKQLSFDLKQHPLYNDCGIQSISTYKEVECNNILIGSRESGIYDISTRTANVVSLIESHCSLTDCIFHPHDESTYATCDAKGMIRIWRVGVLIATNRLQLSHKCNCIEWSHDGNEIIVGCIVGSTTSDKDPVVSCILIDCKTMSIKWTGNDCNETVNIVQFSNHSEMFALVSKHNKIFVYDNRGRSNDSLKPRLRILTDIHKARIRSIDFSKDSYYIQTSSDDYEHIRFNTDDGEIMALPSQLKHIEWCTYTCHFGWPVSGIWPPIKDVTTSSPEPTYVSRSTDKALIAVGLSNGDVKLYPYPCISDAEETCDSAQNVHIGPVSKCIFNSDTSLMISLCREENNLVIWRLTEDRH